MDTAQIGEGQTSTIARAIDSTRNIGELVSDISKGIFDATVRPDCIRGSSTWVGDFVPFGIGTVNYMRRMYDAVGLGPEMVYLMTHLAYQAATTVAIYKGTIELLK